LENSLQIPYQGKINIKDETGGSVSLEDQGIIAKLQEAFDMLGELSKTDATVRNAFFNVLPRNVTIVINGSANELGVSNDNARNTLRCGTVYLQNSTPTQIGGKLNQQIAVMAFIN
jgi:hypothetical protein